MQPSTQNQNSTTTNPWISIWTKPRATLRENVGKNHTLLIFLIIVGSLAETMNRASGNSARDSVTSGTLILLLIFATIVGSLIYYFIVPSLLAWTGRMVGGRGNTGRVRYAVAFSFIPLVIQLLVIWVPSLFLYGMENFQNVTLKIDEDIALLLGFGVIEIILIIWSGIIFVKCLGEAHEFSVWKAILSVVIAFFIVVLPLGLGISLFV
ncbi:YIP1 family protein [Bacillus sp. BGMRC 2118]|nr:YIP1 family protein [Bacillus sp. BGMRC 2118]